MPERRLRLIRHLLPLSIMSYWVYVLTNKKNGVLYTGVTNDLAKRIVQHRSGTGSFFTAKYKLGLLVYAQEFGDPVSAIAAEKAFKKWRRAWKIALIERDNPSGVTCRKIAANTQARFRDDDSHYPRFSSLRLKRVCNAVSTTGRSGSHRSI